MVRDGNDDIYLITLDGTGLRRLTTQPANDFDAAWSPDGRMLAFRSAPDPQTANGTISQSDIWVMNADGSGQVNLTHNPAQENWSPARSPDGMQIAFASARQSD